MMFSCRCDIIYTFIKFTERDWTLKIENGGNCGAKDGGDDSRGTNFILATSL